MPNAKNPTRRGFEKRPTRRYVRALLKECRAALGGAWGIRRGGVTNSGQHQAAVQMLRAFHTGLGGYWSKKRASMMRSAQMPMQSLSTSCRWVITLEASMVLLCLAGAGCSASPAPTAQYNVASETKPVETSSAEGPKPERGVVEQPNWIKTEKTDPMDRTKEIVVRTSAIGQSSGTLVMRFKGKNLDVYVDTGKIVNDESASVRVKFDDAAPMRQTWTRSTDYKAVFSPDPFGLLTRLRLSKQFYIEYPPYQKVPDTIMFNVAGLSAALPQDEMAVQKKKYDDNNAARAALRARILLHVHQCSQESFAPPGQWCWSDPNDEMYKNDVVPFATKEEAVRDAMRMASMGLAFKRP